MQVAAQHQAIAFGPIRRSAAPRSRDRILAAARLLLRESAYSSFSMETVARACGLSRQTLYNQFADRDALYRASRLQLLQSFAPDLPCRLALRPDPAWALERFIADALAILACPEHIELSRSATVDRATCPWVVGLYTDRVERPLATQIEACIPCFDERARGCDRASRAAGLVTMMRSASRELGIAPSFTASEITTLFLGRVRPGPAVEPALASPGQ
ncbi:MAG: TetR family transcriptional regulator [Alphaproteobacteria bacterium]|nr:TetR family transcriptional regulator [Alphaproteobacteria bacterium]